MNERNFRVEAVRGPLVTFSVFSGVSGFSFVASLVLLLVTKIKGGVWALPVILGVACFVFILMDVQYIGMNKAYKLCITKGHKEEAKIINVVTNTIRSRKDTPISPSWSKTWDSVTVEYQAEDGKTYTSTFSVDKASEKGTMITVLRYGKYATFDETAEKMHETESHDFCTCGYKLTGKEYTCPGCGKVLK